MVSIWKRHEYKGAVARFARRYIGDYALAEDQSKMTNADVFKNVENIASHYKVDEKEVAADVLDAVNRLMDKHVRLGPRGVMLPRRKTRREFLAEGRSDLADEMYPAGGSVEELLILKPTELPPPPRQPRQPWDWGKIG